MHAECLVAEYGSLSDARVGLEVLETFDFSADAVSLVSRGDEPELEEIGKLQAGGDAEATSGKTAGLGMLIGGTIATPLSIPSLIGPFFVVGPLAGLAAGAAVGGLFSPARRWGINENVAEEFESRVRNGSVLVIVTSTSRRLDEAEQGLQTTGPKSLERFAYEEATDEPES